MPSITPQVRATIGGSSEEFRQPRALVRASTGMNLPKTPEAQAATPGAEAPKTGQPDIKQEEPTAPAVTLSPQLTALARQQQKLRQEIQAQRDLEAKREAEWAKKEADYVPKGAFKAKLQENAAEALKELGVDYEELTSLLLNQQQGADPVKKLEAEIQKLKNDQEQNVSKQYEATIKQYRSEAKALAESDPKAFFLINKQGAYEAVVQHIVETWEENPDQILTVDQAAKEIEEFLRDEAREKKKLLEELEGPPAEAKPAEKTLPPPKARTLTQQVESTPKRAYNQFQHLSMKERIAQSIARAQK